MSNHLSSDNLSFPGDDTRLDLTDVFAFTSAADPGRTVLIVDSNPTIRLPIPLPLTVITSRDFHPGAAYRINIDDDGDAQADVAFTFTFTFTFTFSELENGTQTATVHYATGAEAREPGPVGHELAASVPPLSRRGASAESLGQVSGLGLIATHDLDGVAARYRPRADGTGHVPGADDADGAHSVCSLPRLELWLCLVCAGSGSARRLSCAFPWRQVIDMGRGHP